MSSFLIYDEKIKKKLVVKDGKFSQILFINPDHSMVGLVKGVADAKDFSDAVCRILFVKALDNIDEFRALYKAVDSDTKELMRSIYQNARSTPYID